MGGVAKTYARLLYQLGFDPESADSFVFIAKVTTCASAAAAWRYFSRAVAGALEVHSDRYLSQRYALVPPTLERYATFVKKN